MVPTGRLKVQELTVIENQKRGPTLQDLLQQRSTRDHVLKMTAINASSVIVTYYCVYLKI